MPAPLSCFEVETIDQTVVARIRGEAARTLPREFAVEINALRPQLAKLGCQNLLIEVEPAFVVAPDHIRGLVFLLRDARQRGGTCAFCGGGPELQQALGKFGLAKPADWFPTHAEALAAIRGAPSAPAAPLTSPAQRPAAPAAPVIARPVPAPAARAPAGSVRPGQSWMPPPRGRYLPAHELTLRAHNRQPILVTPLACAHLAEQIRAVSDQYQFSVWAFVFMPDHFHLLVHSKQLNYDIGDYLDAIKKSFQDKALEILAEHAAQVLGRLRSQHGGKIVYDFWQRTSGQNRNIEYSLPVRPLIQHLHENPVRKGLVTDPLEWKWSSAGAYAGNPLKELQPDPVPAELLGD